MWWISIEKSIPKRVGSRTSLFDSDVYTETSGAGAVELHNNHYILVFKIMEKKKKKSYNLRKTIKIREIETIINNYEIVDNGLTLKEIRNFLIQDNKQFRNMNMADVKKVVDEGIKQNRIIDLKSIEEEQRKLKRPSRRTRDIFKANKRGKKCIDEFLYHNLMIKSCPGLVFTSNVNFEIPWKDIRNGGLQKGEADTLLIEKYSSYKNWERKYKNNLYILKKKFSDELCKCIREKKTKISLICTFNKLFLDQMLRMEKSTLSEREACMGINIEN